MTHHKLYNCVFATKQEEMRNQVTVHVEIPVAPLPFTDAQEVALYEYEKKLQEIEDAEGQKKDERIKEKREVAQQTDEKIKKSYEQVEQIQPPLTQEVCCFHRLLVK